MAVETEVRRHAHELLDRLAQGQLEAVTRLLEVMIHPEVSEDEFTDEDRRAVAASREYFRNNPEGGIPFEEVVAECGFTMDEIRNHRSEQ
jgi:hypothetical protein